MVPMRLHKEKLGEHPGEGISLGKAHSSLIDAGLAAKIPAEPDFKEAEALAQGRTIVATPRLMNLYLLIRFFLPRTGRGHIIEFGSYRGGSALFMAKLAQRHLPGVQVYALDTFQGMPETDKTVDARQACRSTRRNPGQGVGEDMKTPPRDRVSRQFQRRAPISLTAAP